MKTTYGSVIDLQGDDYREFEAALYPGSSAEELGKGFLMGSPDIRAAFHYLMQWEHGDGVDERDTPGWGGGNVAVFTPAGKRSSHPGDRIKNGYVMEWHTGLSCASLTRVTTEV